MKFMTTFLVVLLVLIVAAVAVPMEHKVTITTSRTLAGFDLGSGDIYQVRFRGTMAQYVDNADLAMLLLKEVECTAKTVKAAYAAAGFTDASVTTIG